jgi:glucose-6-phosphate isomerase
MWFALERVARAWAGRRWPKAQAGGSPVTGDLSPGPRLHFLDNLDGAGLAAALDALDLSRTRFFAVSKSGGTGETLIQLIAVLSALGGAGLKPSEHILAITEQGTQNKLRNLLEPEGVRIIDHMDGAGRALCRAVQCGPDPGETGRRRSCSHPRRRGGRCAICACAGGTGDLADMPPAVGAAVLVAMMREQGAHLNVLMGYGDGFERLTRWWVQLWAESLGKEGTGLTPLGAIGPVDQHSQLQLFLDGPRDKLVTLLMRNGSADGRSWTRTWQARRRAGLCRQARGRIRLGAAARHRRHADPQWPPRRRIIVPELNDQAMGALMMHFMLETIIAAHILGVNAFDQPAVEEGKVLAKSYLAGEAGRA